MVASVSELIQLAQAQSRPNPGTEALASGLSRVNVANQPFFEQAGKLIALQDSIKQRQLSEEERKREKEQRKKIEETRKKLIEKRDKGQLKSATTIKEGTGGTVSQTTFSPIEDEEKLASDSIRDDFSSELTSILGDDTKNKKQKLSVLMSKAKTKAERSLVKDTASLVDEPGGQSREMSSNSIFKLNEGAAVARMLPDIAATIEENMGDFGPVEGRIRENNPYDTKGQAISSQMRAISQAFGRFMEGGVLRKEDEEKYRRMFPKLSDKAEVAKSKLEIVRRLLAKKYESDRKTLGKAGFDVTAFDELEIPDSLFGPSEDRSGRQIVGSGGLRIMGVEEVSD